MTLSLSRRAFLKVAAATSAATAMGAGATHAALAETSGETERSVKRVRSCCRGCGKFECGVWVTVENGRAVKIEGDTSAPHSMGNCCNKSVASLQACYHPDRLKYPMKRTNLKGEDPGWVRITWDEAFDTISRKIKEAQNGYGNESLFTMCGTGRETCMQSCPGYAQLFMSINNIIGYQICKGPRHFSAALTTEWHHSWSETIARQPVFIIWASTPEVSNYDEAGRSIIDEYNHAEFRIHVDPRKTQLSNIADLHLALTPGTDGALALSMCNVIIENDLLDDLYVKKWTNAPFLVLEDKEPSGPEAPHIFRGPNFIKTTLLTEVDLREDGDPYKYMVWDNASNSLKWFCARGDLILADPTYDPAADPECGAWEGEPAWIRYDGTGHALDEHWVRDHYAGKEADVDYRPGISQGYLPDLIPFENLDPALYGQFEVTLKDGSAATVRPVFDIFAERCANYAPAKAEEITGVPAQNIEQAALMYGTRRDPSVGNGGIMYQLGIEHAGNALMNCRSIEILTALTGNYDVPGGMRGATKLAVAELGDFANAPWSAELDNPRAYQEHTTKQLGVDKLPLSYWWGLWADAATFYEALNTGEPYPMRAGVCQSGDMMNMGNTTLAYEGLKKLDFFWDVDLWHAPTSELADIILPAPHWLEQTAPRQSQGANGFLGAQVKCVEPPAEVRLDVEACMGLYERAGLPWGDPDNPYPDNHAILDHTISVIDMTWDEFEEKFQKDGWYDVKLLAPDDWGTYRRFQTGYTRKPVSADPSSRTVVPGFNTPTMKEELWSTIMETYHGAADALPDYREAPLSPAAEPEIWKEYPVRAITGRRIPVYFHNEHRQLPWCREVWPVPRMEINPNTAKEYGLAQGDWCWIETPNGKIRQTVDMFYGIPEGMINLEHHWWYPELAAPTHGFTLSSVNQLVWNEKQDPHTGSSVVRNYPVKIYKATAENSPFGNPVPCAPEDGTPIIHDSSDPRLKDWDRDYEGRA